MDAQKNVPGADGTPTSNTADIDNEFPSGDQLGTTIQVKEGSISESMA